MKSVNELLPVASFIFTILAGFLSGYVGWRVSQALMKKTIEDMESRIAANEAATKAVREYVDSQLLIIRTQMSSLDSTLVSVREEMRVGFAKVLSTIEYLKEKK